MTMEDGLHWFAYTEDPDGIICFRGTPKWGSKGCIGAVGDLVALDTWHIVQIAGYPGYGHWVIRVYDINSSPHDVAQITNSSDQIYDATVSFEEGYTSLPNPYYLGKFHFYHPQYRSGNQFLDWPQTALPFYGLYETNHNVAWDNNHQNTICPSHYGANVNMAGDQRYWYGGINALVCDWWFFSPVVSASTLDDLATSSLNYHRVVTEILMPGSWLHTSNWPKTYANTISYTAIQNDKVALTFTGSRITRIYAMANNRTNAEVFIDGVSQGQQTDYASTTRWQVAKTWSMPTSGTHTIEVQKIGSSGFIDLDAFIVDIPYVNSGTYDGTHSNCKYIGSWTLSSPWPLAYNSTLNWSKNTEDAFTFTFYGNSIYYFYTKASNRGKAAVTIDGVNMPLIDLYSASTVWQAQTTYTNLGTGIHTIHISVSGQKNANSSDYYVDVDKLMVP